MATGRLYRLSWLRSPPGSEPPSILTIRRPRGGFFVEAIMSDTLAQTIKLVFGSEGGYVAGRRFWIPERPRRALTWATACFELGFLRSAFTRDV